MGSQGFRFRGERRLLDEAARADAPGWFVTLSDGMVHYEIAGPAEAATVVLVHGFSVPYHIWDPTFRALVGAGLRVLRYDLFGRGYSDRPDANYDKDLFDRQLLELLAALKIDAPIDLLGLSIGGAIAVVFTDRHPERVRRLGLIDPAGLPMRNTIGQKLVSLPVVGEWLMSLLGDRMLLSSLKDDVQGDAIDDGYVQKYRHQMQYAGFKRALLSTIRSGIATGASESYARVGEQDRGVLLIWGRQDRVVPFEMSAEVLELLPEAEFHAIEGAGHIPHYESPDTVNPLLIEFLEREYS